MKLIHVIILLLICISCTKTTSGQVPEAVLKSFAEKYPDEKSPEWEVDDNGLYEAHFKMKGEKYRADFSPSGKWIETESSVKFDDLPERVQDVIEDEYDEDDIVEIELVDHHSKGFFYDVEFKKKGEKFDIELNPLGIKIN